jgi:hypothetical protein
MAVNDPRRMQILVIGELAIELLDFSGRIMVGARDLTIGMQYCVQNHGPNILFEWFLNDEKLSISTND